MLGRLTAIALLAAACATGCRARAYREARPRPAAPKPAGPNAERGDQVTAGAFTIAFSAFIPSDHVPGPHLHPQSYRGLAPPRRLVFAGDDRGFDVDAASYRARQVVTVIPDEAEDPDGLLEGSKRNLGGISESFVASRALSDGRLDARDRDGAMGDRRLDHGRAATSTEGMIIDDPVRLGPHKVFVRLRTSPRGGPRNELIAGSPSIDWDIGITIDASGPEPIYEVAGTWDGYPAAELYINRQAVFTFSPGDGPASTVDLLGLLPGRADFDFARRGTLTQPATAARATPQGPGE